MEYTVSQPMDFSKDEIEKFHEMEVELANQDRIVRETAGMRNDLESYIYDMRDKIITDSQLASYATQKDKDKFNKKQEEVDNWLYEEGYDATKSVYAGKLAELKKIGGPVEARAAEAAARPNAAASKSTELTNLSSPIMHKPAPKPKKVEKPKEEKPKAEPMDTDETPKADEPEKMETEE